MGALAFFNKDFSMLHLPNNKPYLTWKLLVLKLMIVFNLQGNFIISWSKFDLLQMFQNDYILTLRSSFFETYDVMSCFRPDGDESIMK